MAEKARRVLQAAAVEAYGRPSAKVGGRVIARGGSNPSPSALYLRLTLLCRYSPNCRELRDSRKPIYRFANPYALGSGLSAVSRPDTPGG